MADSSILIKDANGDNRELAADLTAGVYKTKVVATGPLTDDELRSSPVPVSGPVTDDELRATPVPVSGPATNAEIRLTPIPVSGPATDAELRLTPLDVTGPVTNTQLRSAPVEVLNTGNVPITSGTYTLAPTTTVTITIPAGAKTLHLFGDVPYRFGVDIVPVAPVGDSLLAGGIGQASVERIVALPTGAASLKILSIGALVVDVEFVG